MRICVFEDQGVAHLEPLTLTRPAFDLRCGRQPLLHRQCQHFGASAVGVLVRPLLAGVTSVLHPDVIVNDPAWLDEAPTILVNARWLPPAESSVDRSAPHVGTADGQVAYVVLSPQERVAHAVAGLDQAVAAWQQDLPQQPAGGVMIRYPWDLVERNALMLERDFAAQASRPRTPLPPGLMLVGPADRLHIDRAAKVDPFVAVDTSNGPVLIEGDAHVHSFSRLEGPCSIGPGTWVLGANVKASSIGPVCRIGGEVEASIFHGYSNKAHEGFVGHSYVGEWVNVGAGTQFSDLRNDYGPVTLTIDGMRTESGLTKVGAFIGDHTKIAIGSLLNTGTVLGTFCNLLPTGTLLPRVVPSFCNVWRGHLREATNLEALLTTAATMMKRRHCQMTPEHLALYRVLFRETYGQRDRLLHTSTPWQARAGA